MGFLAYMIVKREKAFRARKGGYIVVFLYPLGSIYDCKNRIFGGVYGETLLSRLAYLLAVSKSVLVCEALTEGGDNATLF
ncbi:MAG: hypothetical protein J5803_02680 [Desulfovibrio sp.]|nr:hypothetical protein [Desulfovibrio sp.]